MLLKQLLHVQYVASVPHIHVLIVYIIMILIISYTDGKGEGGVVRASFQQQDPTEKMSYTMQALKRNHCLRLSRYIRMCDYMVNNMLHELVLQSVKTILSTMEGYLREPMEVEDIATPIKEDEDEDESVPLLPLKTPGSSIQNTPSVSVVMD